MIKRTKHHVLTNSISKLIRDNNIKYVFIVLARPMVIKLASPKGVMVLDYKIYNGKKLFFAALITVERFFSLKKSRENPVSIMWYREHMTICPVSNLSPLCSICALSVILAFLCSILISSLSGQE
jgi:hypothetical protein